MHFSYPFLLSLITLSASAQPEQLGISKGLSKRQYDVSSDTINKIRDLAISMSTRSWENGTLAQALIEYDNPTLSPFDTNFSPSVLASNPIPSNVLTLARVTLQNRPTTSQAILDSPFAGGSLLNDGSSADPASLGVAVIMANVSEQASGQAEEINGIRYGAAAREEEQYLLYNVPRTAEGAISHRADEAQLWSDYMYMVPPFLAFYGLQTNNQTLLQIAHDQCSLYRTALQDPSTKLWKHIIGGSGNQIAQDTGLWATGNGWAAAGMLRVAATIQRSGYASQMTTQVNDLTGWVTEIIQASSSRVTEAGLVRNYMDQESSFSETSASSLLAYSAFRLSTMGVTSDYTGFANQIHSTVFGNHIASNGTLTGAVDPLSFAEQGTGSPEGQSFVLLMQAAYQEFRSAGGSDDTNPGKENAAVRMSGLLGSWAGMVFAVGVGLVTLI